MEHEKKLAFIAKMTKMGLDHIQTMDTGGAIIPSNPTPAPVAGPVPAASTNANTNQSNGIFGAVNDILGLGNNFKAGTATIQPGTNASQLNNSYTGVNNAIDASTRLANQTQPGVAQGLASESTLSGQLADEAAGLGPNPAAAALNASTGRNVAGTNAAIAGARGSNNNVGLLTRQAAQTGAGIEQNAAGQAATLQAQQQLAAQQEAQNLAATQVNQGANSLTNLNQEQQAEQGILQGANNATNNANVSMQGNINSTNAQTAASNQNANAGTGGGILSGIGSVLGAIFEKGGLVKMDKGGNVLDANARKQIAPENFALPGGRYPIHDVNHARNALARVSQFGTPAEKTKVKMAVHKKYPELAGKKMAAGGAVADCGKKASEFDASFAKGGMIRDGYLKARRMADGGFLAPTPLVVNNTTEPLPQSFASQWLNSENSSGPTVQSTSSLPQASNAFGNAISNAGSQIADYINKPEPTAATTGGNAGVMAGLAGDEELAAGGLAAKGGNVRAGSPQEKATVKGDSLKNDKIPALLSEGEVVMDRETLSDPGTLGQMARAVAKQIEKRNKGKKV